MTPLTAFLLLLDKIRKGDTPSHAPGPRRPNLTQQDLGVKK